jgi:FkbM family methyltransferase
MNLNALAKALALQLLPERLLQGLKKFHYRRSLRSATEADEPDLRVVRHLIRPGTQVVDVGANFGIYTKFLSNLVGPGGRVYSVEPVPLTFEILTANVRRLDLTNVEPLNFAVSCCDEPVVMEVPRYASGGENFYEARVVAGSGSDGLRHIAVQARTLDTLFADLRGGVDFIKCDVEGHELRCLRGAPELLRKVKPAWLLEVSGDPDNGLSSASEVFHTLAQRGYEPYWFDGQHLRKRAKGERSTNYFFLTARHLRRLPPNLLAAPAVTPNRRQEGADVNGRRSRRVRSR